MAEMMAIWQAKNGIPIPLAYLKLWLKADAGITLNGSNVSAWADQSGNGYNAAQSSASLQPLFLANDPTANNKPTIHFNSDQLVGSIISGINTTSMSVFVVAKNDAYVGDGIMFALGNAAYNFNKDSNGRMLVFNNAEAQYSTSKTVCNNAGTPFRVYSAVKELNVVHNVYVNSVNEINSKDAAFIGGIIAGKYIIGMRTGGGVAYIGNIAEIIVYNTNLNSILQAQVENYLKIKYSIV